MKEMILQNLRYGSSQLVHSVKDDLKFSARIKAFYNGICSLLICFVSTQVYSIFNEDESETPAVFDEPDDKKDDLLSDPRGDKGYL
jgi:hypothetical protein